MKHKAKVNNVYPLLEIKNSIQTEICLISNQRRCCKFRNIFLRCEDGVSSAMRTSHRFMEVFEIFPSLANVPTTTTFVPQFLSVVKHSCYFCRVELQNIDFHSVLIKLLLFILNTGV